MGILGRRNYTGTIWDFREIIFGLPGTIGKNITASSTRKTAETVSDRLRPSQTMSKLQEKTLRDRLRPSQTMSKLQQEPSNSICIHTVQVQFFLFLQSSQYSLSRLQNSSWIVSADFILVSGCPKFYVTNWPIMRAVAVTKIYCNIF